MTPFLPGEGIGTEQYYGNFPVENGIDQILPGIVSALGVRDGETLMATHQRYTGLIGSSGGGMEKKNRPFRNSRKERIVFLRFIYWSPKTKKRRVKLLMITWKMNKQI